MSVVCVHGRFQPLHIDHLRYILAARQLGERLVVGITQVVRPSRGVGVDDHRESASANPLTYFERTRIIRDVLSEAGIDPSATLIVPFPIEHPQLIQQFVPEGTLMATTVVDAWNQVKIARLTAVGFEVQIVLPGVTTRTSATAIRRMIALGDERWREFVPPATARHIDRLDLRSRIVSH